ncbi:hypothetical protein EC968_008070 [Mortierella alpina]|nr:hypothetical protein EC968_008070 [Mortierella alpina]
MEPANPTPPVNANAPDIIPQPSIVIDHNFDLGLIQDLYPQQITTDEHRELVRRFLYLLKDYLDTTMENLFGAIDQISELMFEYDQDLEEFVANLAPMTEKFATCTEQVQMLIDEHDTALQTLGGISSKVIKLRQTQQHKATGNAKAADSARTAGQVLMATTGIAVGVVVLLVLKNPSIASNIIRSTVAASATVTAGTTAATGAIVVAQATATVSGLSFSVANYKESNSTKHAAVAAQLGNVSGCNEKTGGAFDNIHRALQDSKQSLIRLNKENQRLAKGSTLTTYERAQARAAQIIAQCNSIRELGSQISVLRGAVADRIEEELQA